MYESPIHLYITDITTQIMKQQEEQILKAVQSVAVGVNHEELFRALKFDRDQYKKGYQDAIREKGLVEVVRCKDCKWAEYGKDYDPYCNHWKSGLYANIKVDDFCSYGERKEENELV